MYEFITSRENESFDLTNAQMLSVISFLFNSDIGWYDPGCHDARCSLTGRGSSASYEAHVNRFNNVKSVNPMLSELAVIPELRAIILTLPEKAAGLYNFAVSHPKLLKGSYKSSSSDLVARMVNFALTRAGVLYDALNSGYDIRLVPETKEQPHISDTYVRIPVEQRRTFSSMFINGSSKVWGITGNWLGIEYNSVTDSVLLMDGTIAWIPSERWPTCDGFPKTREGCSHTFNKYVEYLVQNNDKLRRQWSELSGDTSIKRKAIFDKLWTGATVSEWRIKLKTDPESFTNSMVKLLSDKII